MVLHCRSRFRIVPPAVLAALLFDTVGPPAAPAETTAQFDVTATITSGCLVDGFGSSGDIGRMGELVFGRHSTFSTATPTASTDVAFGVRFRCTPGVNLTVNIDGGQQPAGGVRYLQRAGGTSADRMAYSVCRDPLCAQPIAINANFVTAVTSANSEDVRFPIYGSVSLPGDLAPGDYSDILTVTVTW